MGKRMTLTFDIKRGMYGTCRRIVGRVGLAGTEFAAAYFDDVAQKWDVVIHDAAQTEYSVDVTDREKAIEQVQAIMNLAYRSANARKAA